MTARGAMALSLVLAAGCGSGADAASGNPTVPGSDGGAGGAGADAADGSGPLVEGCFDLTIGGELLGAEFLPGGEVLPGGLWATNDGHLQVAWQVEKNSADVTINPLGAANTHLWLVLSTLDGTTGTWITHRTYDVVPKEYGASATDFRLAGGNPDGAFGAAYYYENRNQNYMSPEWLMLGSVSDPSMQITFPLTSDDYDVPAPSGRPVSTASPLAWDGEAFVWHGYGGGPLWLERVDPQGNVVTPLTQFGHTGEIGYGDLGFKVSTDATTGMSYVLDPASGFGPARLSGHDRAGAPLVGTEQGPKVVEPVGIASSTSVYMDWIDATPDGMWAVWTQFTSQKPPLYEEAILQHIGIEGSADRPAQVIPPPAPDPHVIPMATCAVLGLSDATPLVVCKTYKIYAFWNVLDPQAVIDSASSLAPDEDPGLDARSLMLAETTGGEVWLSFIEYPPAALSKAIRAQHRLVRVKPGCTYPRKATKGAAAAP